MCSVFCSGPAQVGHVCAQSGTARALSSLAENPQFQGKVRMYGRIDSGLKIDQWGFGLAVYFIGEPECRNQLITALRQAGIGHNLRAPFSAPSEAMLTPITWPFLPEMVWKLSNGPALLLATRPARAEAQAAAAAIMDRVVSTGDFTDAAVAFECGMRLAMPATYQAHANAATSAGRGAGRGAGLDAARGATPAAADDGEIEFVAEKSWAQRDAELRAKAVVLDDGEGTMPSQGSSATKDEAAMPGCVYMSDGTIVID